VNERQALARAEVLAGLGWGEVEPNPTVGAVVLSGGEVVGEGHHAVFGGPHAEIVALSAAGRWARGATVCVTLEPCCTHGKTPPCTRALIAAGVRRVVVGCVDPAPAHAGRGLEELRAAGIEVQLAGTPGSAELIRRFAAGLDRRRPHVVAKWAMSADGAIAGPGGRRVQLSGPEAVARLHAWRAALDAIVVGVGTVLADDPQLTARGPGPRWRPLRRVVLDQGLRTPPGSRLASSAHETPTWILTGEDPPSEAAETLRAQGVELLCVPLGPGWLAAGLELLWLRGVRRLLVEGGARTHAALLAAQLADQLALVLTPQVLGPDAVPALPGVALGGLEPAAIAQQLALVDWRVEALGADRLLRGWRQADGARGDGARGPGELRPSGA